MGVQVGAMHLLQIWMHRLGICKISKINLLISRLKNVRHRAASTCCLCWSDVVANNSFVLPSPYWGFAVTLIFRHITLGTIPLDEWSARRRDLYLTTYNTHKTQKCMPPARFEPTIPATEQPQTHALDRAATGIVCICKMCCVTLYRARCFFPMARQPLGA
jgi:hypothetical protein